MTLISMKAIANAALKELAQLRANCDRCQNPLLKKRHTCGASTLRKDRAKEDLTKLTDTALEERIFYSQDARAGEPFGPLWDEYKRRYTLAKQGRDYFQELAEREPEHEK